MSTCKLICWNVNGLRAVHKRGFLDWLGRESPDVCCLGETKVSLKKLPPELLEIPGYRAHYLAAEREGYAGVALLTKPEPLDVRFGLGVEEFDREGRVITARYDSFTLVNTYFPNGKASSERLAFKMAFYDRFLEHLESLKPQPIVICGDVNTAHKEIDLARPKENAKVSGFLPEERAWIDRLVAAGYVDAFRLFSGEPGQYTWWDMKTGARARNVGWRIDYFFVSEALRPRVRSASIQTEVMGSDHCPITLELDI